jgi:ribonuclease P protein component
MSEIILRPLKGKLAIADLFNNGRRIHSDSSMAFVKLRNSVTPDETVIVSYVVSISKRTAKKAIIRNRIKRLLRESLRLSAMEPALVDKISRLESIILLWRKAPEHHKLIHLKDILPIVQRMLNSIDKKNASYYKEG